MSLLPLISTAAQATSGIVTSRYGARQAYISVEATSVEWFDKQQCGPHQVGHAVIVNRFVRPQTEVLALTRCEGKRRHATSIDLLRSDSNNEMK